MKAVLFALAACFGCLAQSQELKDITLGAPQFVAKQVKEVYWSPDGRSLAYSCDTKEGPAIGVYDVDQADGKTVLKLAKDDVVESVTWLSVGKKAIVVLRNQGVSTTVTVTVLDAHDLNARQLWVRQFEKGKDPSVDIDVSPSLAHALVTVNSEKASETWVLTQGAGGFVFSRDIAAAKEQGQNFAGWSNAGTAIFGTSSNGSVLLGSGGSGGSVRLSAPAGDLSKVATGVATVEFTTALPTREAKPADVSDAVTLELGKALNRVFSFRVLPNIEKGATCLECVPSNGVLRQVKFPGYFEESGGPTVFPDLHSKLQLMKLGKTETGSQALWLVSQPQGVPQVAEDTRLPGPRTVAEPPAGLLVSAQADQWWPSPYTRSIAFVWNGVLFVRTVKYPVIVKR